MINLDCNGNEIRVDARVKCYVLDTVLDGVVKAIPYDNVFDVEIDGGLCSILGHEMQVYAMSWTAVHEKEYQEMIAKRK